jgi:hypothetical protein
MMKKSRKLACYVVNSNIVIDSFPTLQISSGIITLFENIYDGKSILIIISNIGEDTIPSFNYVYDVKSVTQPDTVPVLGNNY